MLRYENEKYETEDENEQRLKELRIRVQQYEEALIRQKTVYEKYIRDLENYAARPDHDNHLLSAGHTISQILKDRTDDKAINILTAASNVLNDNSVDNRNAFAERITQYESKQSKSNRHIGLFTMFLGAALMVAGVAVGFSLVLLPVALPLFFAGASLCLLAAKIYERNKPEGLELSMKNFYRDARPGHWIKNSIFACKETSTTQEVVEAHVLTIDSR